MEQLFQFALNVVALHHLQALVNDLISHHFYECWIVSVGIVSGVCVCIFYIIVLKNIRHYCVFIFSKCSNSTPQKNTFVMSDQVHLPDTTFDHARLHLAPPNGLQGGTYFAMMYYRDAPLYIQTPKCTSRQAVVPGKRPYIDLMFSSNDVSFLEWLEALEADAVRLIYEKRNTWISADLERSDIEAGFTSPVRPYKGGKHYLIRAHIQPAKHLAGTQSSSCSVFDENERPVSVDHIKAEHQMYTVLEFQGIKFTSRSFQLEVALKQVLLVSNVPIFQSCVIRKPNPQIPTHDAPNNDAPNNDAPNNDAPNNDAPNNDAPNNDAPNNDAPNNDAPNNDAPNNDAPHPCQPELHDSHQLQEINLDVLEELEHMHLKLKKPTEVYYNMYRNIKQKAKEFKKNAIAAYLEAKQIKSTHMLEDSDSDSDSDNGEFM
jgi:hypothetical protein